MNQQVEDALNTIVKLTNESGNLKELRKSIHEKVSGLRNLIYTIKDNLHEKISKNAQQQNEVNEMKKSQEAQRNTQAGQLAPSMCNTQESSTTGNSTSTPPSEGRKKQYAEVLSGKKGTSYKLTVRTKDNQTTDTVKTIIKSNIDPTHMKIGIRKFKGLQNGKVLIEADTEEDIEVLKDQISRKCGDKLETGAKMKITENDNI